MQNLDWMDKNCVRRRGAPGELAIDSEAPKRIKAALRKRSQGQGKVIVPYPGRSAKCLVDKTEEIERFPDRVAEVSRGHISRWSNDHPGRAGKPAHRAKGRTVKNWVEGRQVAAKTVESWQDQT